jgi:hypothetical protein
MVAALAISAVACSEGDSADRAAQVRETDPTSAASTPIQLLDPGEPCPITAPTDATSLPPVLAEDDSQWYGEDELWVSLPLTQAKTVAPVNGRYRIKFATVTLRAEELTDEFGTPTMHAQRLDGRGSARSGFGGYAMAGPYDEPFGFWPTGLDFSDPGCWLVTSAVSETTIEFALKVGRRSVP